MNMMAVYSARISAFLRVLCQMLLETAGNAPVNTLTELLLASVAFIHQLGSLDPVSLVLTWALILNASSNTTDKCVQRVFRS